MEIEIRVGNGKDYKVIIAPLSEIDIDGKVAIVTNPKVAGLHLKKLLSSLSAKEVYIITVDDGEEHKNLSTIEKILNSCFNHKLNRSSTLIALGGGVVGDMTGFAASIYQRGVSFIQIPTTLLSMVDASVGGKTGVNSSFGKNLIGTFHQPKAVYIDTEFLTTLPNREFRAGVAEIIKMAVVFDSDFFDFLESNRLDNDENLQKAIKRSLELKAKVVSADELERGSRALLNYGHTFAHVIENLTNYRRYLHGEAVSIGMSMANKLAIRAVGFSSSEDERVDALLESYELPRRFFIEDLDRFYNRFFLDKKSLDSKLKFILPISIGEAKIFDDIKKEDILNTLELYS